MITESHFHLLSCEKNLHCVTSKLRRRIIKSTLLPLQLSQKFVPVHLLSLVWNANYILEYEPIDLRDVRELY